MGHSSEVTTVIWFLVGAIGAGAMVALGSALRPSETASPQTRLHAATARLRRWYGRRSEIRLLQRWYAAAEAPTQTGAQRFLGHLVLAVGPLAAAAAAALLAVVAVPRGPQPFTALLLVGAAVVALAASWRTAAALALAANVTGLFALVISRSTPAGWLPITDVVAALAALAALVGLSAIVRSLRQPPRLLDLAPSPPGAGPAEHGEPLGRAA
jgi:hypothetical protein